MIKEITLIYDIYDSPKEGEEPKLLKANLKARRLVNTTDIRYVDEFTNDKGKIDKRYCLIKIDDGLHKINHSFDEVRSWVTQNKIGFKPIS